jgi:hypothetical protein
MKALALWLGLATAAGFSGCVAAPGDARASAVPPQPDALSDLQAILAKAPCDSGVPTTGSSANLIQLANRSIEHAEYGELDVSNHLLLAARAQPSGFDIYDVHDPLRPVPVGEYQDEKNQGSRDIKFSPDNTTAFVATGARYIDIVDIRDPTNPIRIGKFDLPNPQVRGPNLDAHMIYAKRIGGANWLFVATLSDTGVWILKIEGGPGSYSLKFVTRTLPVEGGVLGPHDMWVNWDPILRKPLLYAADGTEGWSAWEVSDPSSPQLLVRVPNADPNQEYTHTIQAAFVGQRRIVATIGEVGANALKVYDATNLQLPLLLGSWQAAPGTDHTSPQHNFNIVNGYLIMAHYSRGVYVFNLSRMPGVPLTGLAQLRPMAHFEAGNAIATGPIAWQRFWDAIVEQGVVYASDATNLRVLGFGCLHPGLAGETSNG